MKYTYICGYMCEINITQRRVLGVIPESMAVDEEAAAVAPAVPEAAEEHAAGLGVESALAVGLAFPKVGEPAVPGVEIEPALGEEEDGVGEGERVNARLGGEEAEEEGRRYLAVHEVIPPRSLENVAIAVAECARTASPPRPPHAVVEAAVSEG